ncbi:rhomboid family intramembrane serine protease [uncultured Marinococcus sp.]|jgi:rhomboid protease GluP|uniref:rhomboid family intramembrane serine protease n=1 Tax=uncultured Marinococcus sp. TaxID=487012 RepID=UPI00260A90BD|nr:rhomboid family intramembrane serine protease [uncultured Marinococcus sp.]
MSKREAHQFWKFTEQLMEEESFRLIDVGPDRKRIWLQGDVDGQPWIVRVARVEYERLGRLEDDRHEAEKSFHGWKRRLALRKAKFANVYITSYPPADMAEPLESGDSDARSFLFANDNGRGLADAPPAVSTYLKTSEWTWGGLEEELEAEEHEQRASFYRRQAEKRQRELEEQDMSFFSSGKPIVTYTVLALLAVIFLVLERSGSSMNLNTLIELGAKYNPGIVDGEWWRLITAMFLHIGFLHLFMNSLALFFIGGITERIYGTARFIIIYFAAGVFASTVSFAMNEQVSAGASGAIFGCFGALLYLGLAHQRLFFRTLGMNVLVILGINLVFGFTVQAVDNGAHIGGLVGGFIASVFVHLPGHRWQFVRVGALAFFVLAFAVFFAIGMYRWN